MNRKWLTWSLVFSSGVAMGVAASWTYLEAKANEKYRTWVKMRIGTEEHVKKLREQREAIPVLQIKTELKADLTEHERISTPYIPTREGSGRSYSEFEVINEDIYNTLGSDLDKITIEIYRDDLQYQLVVDGETVIDWQDILTPVIIEDLKGKDGIYLRNHRKKEDYYVTWGRP